MNEILHKYDYKVILYEETENNVKIELVDGATFKQVFIYYRLLLYINDVALVREILLKVFTNDIFVHELELSEEISNPFKQVLEIADDLYPTPVTADKKLPVLFRKEKVRNSVVVIVSEFENY